jgi:hypothetical protein
MTRRKSGSDATVVAEVSATRKAGPAQSCRVPPAITYQPPATTLPQDLTLTCGAKLKMTTPFDNVLVFVI